MKGSWSCHYVNCRQLNLINHSAYPVNTDLQSKSSWKGSKPCGKHRCITCKMLYPPTEQFTSTTTGETFKIQGSFTCDSTNLIYLIQCRKCRMQYIGQTGTSLTCRMAGHRHDIKYKLEKPVSQHFTKLSHNGTHCHVVAIDKAPSDVTSRLLRETSWIRRLVTLEPHGLNKVE